MNSKKITHVLYDMDGLLLDTEQFYTIVTQEIVGKFGKTFDWSVKSRMIGKKAIDAANILVNALNLPIKPEQYLEQRNERLRELFPSAEPLPGAMRLTQHLARQGIPQGVATSTTREMFALKTSRHKSWFDVFQTVITGDDPRVKQGKPAPDIFLAVADELGGRPEDCLVFEDAPSGMEAALKAGMSVVVVPDPNMAHDVYREAHQILNSLEEFNPKLWGLPVF
ncbi:MAG: HAD-IA family hydrolase [SAR324 cluster bacterium]|nr:HAD-IA family hydrolase [SAR324 cluster bacterium]